ncbi:MAG: glycosyltransferase family 9 protein [Planctomycetota bacterium]
MPPERRVFRQGLVATGRPPGTTKSFVDPRAILLIQLDHLGDAILSTGMFPALRKRYPKASIEVLAGPAGRELFEAVAEIDRVHVCRVNRFGRASRLGWIASMLWWGCRLRSRRVDLGIDVRGEFPHAVILWLSGARRRLGWNCGGGGFLLTDSPRFVVDRPEVESRMALLAELDIHPEAADEVPRPVFRPSDESRRRVAAMLAQSCLRGGQRLTRGLSRFSRRENGALPLSNPDGPRIVMHVGAGTPAKQWPLEHWRELVGRLVVRLNARVVLVGGPDDRRIARAILERQPCPGVLDWTGRLGLEELAAALEEADLFVGADSGPAHLAAAVGTPAVVLFSGTNSPRQWQPCGENVCVLRHPVECSPCHRRRCPWRDHPCMRGLAPGRVSETVEAECRRTVQRRSEELHVLGF